MKLIREDNFSDVQVTSELNESTGNKKWFIEGVFAEQEQKNRNGRVYPSQVLEREMNKYQRIINECRAIGELNHPSYPIPDPKEACHRVVEIYQKGNDWYGKSLILAGTKYGDHVIAMLENGCKLGVSTRGVGSLKINESGVGIVQEDYQLNCWDIVLNPSANKAYVNGIYEGAEYEMHNGVLVESQHVKPIPQALSESAKLKAVDSLKDSLIFNSNDDYKGFSRNIK